MIVRSEDQWFDLFEKHDASGLSAAQFCRDEKLCTRYFSKRKKQLCWRVKKPIFSVKPKKPVNDFIKISVSKSNANLSLEHGDLKLCWSELPPADWLSDFIKTLK
jgi:hypothetical protein